MRTDAFQELLFKSAIYAIACDGIIEDSEIQEIRILAENEIYLLGYDFELQLERELNDLKNNGDIVISNFLLEFDGENLNEKQELLLLEVLIKAIESDKKVNSPELNFLQTVRKSLKMSDETLITRFPKQISYFISDLSIKSVIIL